METYLKANNGNSLFEVKGLKSPPSTGQTGEANG